MAVAVRVFYAGSEGGFGVGFESAGVSSGKRLACGLGGGESVGVHRAEPVERERDFAVEGEDADVFRAHDALIVGDVLFTQCLDQGGADESGLRRVVDGDGGGLRIEDSDGRRLVGGKSGGGSEAGGHAVEAVDYGLSGLVGEGAGGELELDLVGDDVALGAAAGWCRR